MKHRIKQLMTQLAFLALILIAIPGAFVVASNINNALYFGTVIISNNSTANTNVATVANISTQSFIDGGYLNATANNTVMRNSSGADVPFAPAYPGSPWWYMFVSSIGANSYLTYLLYTDNSFDGEIRYFPGTAGMVVADNNSLELTANFSISQYAYIDTTAGPDKDLVEKLQAFSVSVSDTVDGEIEVSLQGAPNDCLDFIRPNSDWVRIPDHADFSFTDGAGNDEPFTIIAWVDFDDATNSSLFAKYAGGQREYWLLTDGADLLTFELSHLNGAATIRVTSLARTGDEGTWYHYAATYDGSEANVGMEIYRNGVNIVNARAGGGAYLGMADGTENPNIGSTDGGILNLMDGRMAEVKVYNAELTPAEVLADYNGDHRTADLVAYWEIDEGAGLPQDSSGNGHHANQNLADWVNTFPNRFAVFLTATGISVGEHLIRTFADSVNMSIVIDGTIEDSQVLGGISVPNTATNWTFFKAAGTPYAANQTIYVGGNFVQYMQWAYDTIFTDESTAGTNPAYPTFLTGSADADIIGNMTAFTPIQQAQAPQYTLGPVAPFISSTPNITSAFTDVPPIGTFPLAGVIAVIANATATPPQLPLLIIACFVIIAASLTTSYTMRKFGSGSLIIKSLVIISIMGIFVALGDFGIDFWMIFVFGIIATALALMSRQTNL